MMLCSAYLPCLTASDMSHASKLVFLFISACRTLGSQLWMNLRSNAERNAQWSISARPLNPKQQG